jgi:hypothetical protein
VSVIVLRTDVHGGGPPPPSRVAPPEPPRMATKPSSSGSNSCGDRVCCGTCPLRSSTRISHTSHSSGTESNIVAASLHGWALAAGGTRSAGDHRQRRGSSSRAGWSPGTDECRHRNRGAS